MVLAGDDITTEVVKESASKGIIKVVKGDKTSSVQILVVASNGKGQKDYEIINFNSLEFTTTAVDVAFEVAGGSATIQMTSNVDYKITPSEEVTWMTYDVVASEDGTSKTMTVNAVENPLRKIRTVVLSITDEYGYVIEEITVAQAAADYPAGGQMGDINILPA